MWLFNKKSDLTKPTLIIMLKEYWDNLGGDADTINYIEKEILKSKNNFNQLKKIALDTNADISARKVAIKIATKFNSANYLQFLIDNFVEGKNPSELYIGFENGDKSKGDEFALFREAKGILEERGYTVNIG